MWAQFSSAVFAQFVEEYGFIHSTTSSRYTCLQANGEQVVKTVKNILKKDEDPS